jgi:uncharacterized protein (DUF1778 family)
MAGTTDTRRERVQLRLDELTKRAFERAAAYERKTVTQFVLEHASTAAERVIAEHERVRLAPADWDAFFDALVKPPAPNKRLREVVRWYRGLAR